MVLYFVSSINISFFVPCNRIAETLQHKMSRQVLKKVLVICVSRFTHPHPCDHEHSVFYEHALVAIHGEVAVAV